VVLIAVLAALPGKAKEIKIAPMDEPLYILDY
jgi:hypothetical protein